MSRQQPPGTLGAQRAEIQDRIWGNTGLYWGYIGINEKRMETTKMGYIGRVLETAVGLLRPRLALHHLDLCGTWPAWNCKITWNASTNVL